MKKILKITVLILIVLGIFYWVGSILHCEILTKKYVHQFEDAYKEHTMLMECEKIRVLEYTETSASVYYITRGRGSGSVLRFERESAEKEWSFAAWEVIWSTSGSADNFIWPYIR